MNAKTYKFVHDKWKLMVDGSMDYYETAGETLSALVFISFRNGKQVF